MALEDFSLFLNQVWQNWGLIFLPVKSHWIQLFGKIHLPGSPSTQTQCITRSSSTEGVKLFCKIVQQITPCNNSRHILWHFPHRLQSMGKKNLDLLYSIWTLAKENLPKIRIINSFTQAVFYERKKHRMGLSKINKNSTLLTKRTFCVIQKYLQSSKIFYHQKDTLAFEITTFSYIFVYWWPLN